VLGNPDDNPMTVHEWTCDVCKGIAAHRRVVDDRHAKADERLGKKPSPETPRAADGHHMALRYLTPAELVERERGRAAEAGKGGRSA
jgi:hypothetical protein